LAFVRQGAKVIFADSETGNPNVDANKLESLITPKTKAVVVVHYAGIACDMDAIMALSEKHNLVVIEDAAQAIDSFSIGRPLGAIGHLAAFSFHETKNIIAGEGGLLAINDEKYIGRSEVIWEKGTNRASFFRGEVNKYGWVDTGSSFLPSEVIAAFLYAQLENLDKIQAKRKKIWLRYYEGLEGLKTEGRVKLPVIPDFATNNAHMFFIICHSLDERTGLIKYLKERDLHAVFHYISLHKSDFYSRENDVPKLINADYFTDHLLRLPFYYELGEADQDSIVTAINEYYANA
jgi:dTDP-4-amino-4,6-dideoxygalactose transaminase